MSIAEVKQLPLAEKLQIMEAIWEDLRVQAGSVPVPQWHRDLLDERRKAVEEGREELLDWDSIKDSLPTRRNVRSGLLRRHAEIWTRVMTFTSLRR
jgi:putative addiction module component (TIGR02574 family)